VVEQSFEDVKTLNLNCGPRVYELEKAEDYKNFFTIDFKKRPIKMSLLSLNDSDTGSYDLNLKVTLKNWPHVKAVVIPFKVQVTPCTPLTLLPKKKPESIALDMKKGEDGQLTTLMPTYV
jgi:hypothetical protein